MTPTRTGGAVTARWRCNVTLACSYYRSLAGAIGTGKVIKLPRSATRIRAAGLVKKRKTDCNMRPPAKRKPENPIAVYSSFLDPAGLSSRWHLTLNRNSFRKKSLLDGFITSWTCVKLQHPDRRSAVPTFGTEWWPRPKYSECGRLSALNMRR